MVFVNPFLLAGAGLVALPIVLHLVMRRKPKLLEFPALQFVQRRHDTNRRQLRLRHLLLLALRMALVALVAFALARPSVRVSGGVLGGQKEPVAAVLVFDTSTRMEYRHENLTRLEAAQRLGSWLLSQLPAESEVAVLDSRLGPGAFQVDLGAAKHRMERLETSANVQPLPNAVEEALRLLGTSKLARKEVYVFTDMARVAWRADAAARLQDRFAGVPEVGLYVIDVGIAEPSNCALGDVNLSREVLATRGTLKINTELVPTGIGGERTVELYLLEPDPERKELGERKPVKCDQQTVSLVPGQPQQLAFERKRLGLGTYQGYLQVLGGDGLPADDRRYFTVEVKPPWPVLVVAPQPTDNYTLFVSQALAPEEARRRGEARFDCAVIAQEVLAAQSLEGYRAICLLDPKPMEAAVWQRLADFVGGGGGLAVFLGRNAEPVESFNRGPAQQLLAGALVRKAGSTEQRLQLAPRDYEHPILAAFRGLAMIPWSDDPVYRYWQLSDPPPGARVVVPFNNEDAAILERPLGKGRAVTVTTPASDNVNRSPWNLLPVDWPFFILVNTMTEYLAGSTGQQLNYVAGQTAVLELDPRQPFRTYVLTGPDGVEVRLSPDLKDQTLTASGTDQPGNYRVQAGGSADGVDRGFSVNLSAAQTRLERIPQEDLSGVFGPIPYRVAQSRDQIELSVTTGRVGRELFSILILAAAAVLGLEQVVANRFYRE